MVPGYGRLCVDLSPPPAASRCAAFHTRSKAKCVRKWAGGTSASRSHRVKHGTHTHSITEDPHAEPPLTTTWLVHKPTRGVSRARVGLHSDCVAFGAALIDWPECRLRLQPLQRRSYTLYTRLPLLQYCTVATLSSLHVKLL